MQTIQLSDSIFVEVADGDLFMYKYDYNHSAIIQMSNNKVPPIDEYTTEILSFHSKRHFLFKRNGKSYWWEEVKF